MLQPQCEQEEITQSLITTSAQGRWRATPEALTNAISAQKQVTKVTRLSYVTEERLSSVGAVLMWNALNRRARWRIGFGVSGHNALSSTAMQHSDRNRNRQQVLEHRWRLRPPGDTKSCRQPASTLGLADPHLGDRETTARLAGMSLQSSTTQTRISRTADDLRSRTGAAHAAARDNNINSTNYI